MLWTWYMGPEVLHVGPRLGRGGTRVGASRKVARFRAVFKRETRSGGAWRPDPYNGLERVWNEHVQRAESVETPL